MFTQNLPPLAATLAPLSQDPVEAIRVVAQLGFRAIQWSATTQGMRPRDLDSSSRRGLASHLARSGLVCGGVDLFIPSAHFVLSAEVDRAIDAVALAAGLAATLGRCPVSLTLPESTDATAAMLAEARRAIATHADREGIRIADHGIAALGGESAGKSGSTIGIGVDPPALLGAGLNPVDEVAKAGHAIVSARVCDLLVTGVRAPAGEPHDGRLELEPYAAALAVIPLATCPVADARQWSDPRAGLEAMLRRWQDEVPA